MQIERFPIHTSEPGESRFGISPKALDFINMIFVMNKLILSIIYIHILGQTIFILEVFYSEINKKTIPAVIWVYAYCLGSLAIRLSTDQWLFDPPLQAACFFFVSYFGYYTLGDIQALTITYAIVAPKPIKIVTKLRFNRNPFLVA
jgi:hypothetical protein